MVKHELDLLLEPLQLKEVRSEETEDGGLKVWYGADDHPVPHIVATLEHGTVMTIEFVGSPYVFHAI